MNLKHIVLSGLMIGLIACSCGKSTSTQTTATTNSYQKISPDLNADSAYYFVDRQAAFGFRIPNTQAHKECGDYLVEQLTKYGAKVTEQKVDLKAYDGTILHARNIIGSYNPESSNRVLLFAHWDSRPYADQDPDESLHKSPILGANDGASGVGVLLEIARIIQANPINIGVDIIFFDAEDYGMPKFSTQESVLSHDGYALGSEYWSKNPHVPNYRAKFGILLDMVGGTDATFYKELYSVSKARDIVEKIWSTARDLGYGKYFVDKNGTGVYDDHVPVIENRRIPCVDIIQHDPNMEHNFGWYWHTSRDNMDAINKETLKAVGQTILEVIYKEK